MRQLNYDEMCFVAGGEGEKEGPTQVDEILVTAAKKKEDDSDSGGGWYVNFGLGLGLGFNLHIDGDGVDLSVGTGVWGTLEVGHADNDEAMKDKAELDKAFAEVKVAELPVIGDVGVSGEYDMKSGAIEVGLGPFTGSTDNQAGVGPFSVSSDSQSVGVDAGIGAMWYVGHRDWSPPTGNDPAPAQP